MLCRFGMAPFAYVNMTEQYTGIARNSVWAMADDSLVMTKFADQQRIGPHPFLSLAHFDLPLFTGQTGKQDITSSISLKDITVSNTKGETALHIASKIGNVANVIYLLKLERDNATKSGCTLLTAETFSGRIPLHDAVSDNVIKALLSFEASDAGLTFPPLVSDGRKSQLLEWKDHADKTPLMHVVESCDKEMFKWLFERYKLNLNQRTTGGQSLFDIAKESRNLGVVEILSKELADDPPEIEMGKGKQRAE